MLNFRKGSLCFILYAFNVGLALDTPMDFKRLPVATFLSYAYLGAIGEDNFFCNSGHMIWQSAYLTKYFAFTIYM